MLHNDSFKLDASFKHSLMIDMAKASIYIYLVNIELFRLLTATTYEDILQTLSFDVIPMMVLDEDDDYDDNNDDDEMTILMKIMMKTTTRCCCC